MDSRIIEAELRITGSDKSGAAFAGVVKHAQELQRLLGKGMKLDDPGFAKHNAEIREQTKLLQSERRAAQELQRSLALANGEMGRHVGMFTRAKGLYNSAAGQLGMMATGAMAGHTVRSAATDAADLAHQRALLGAGGMKPADVKSAIAASWKAARSVPTATAADGLKTIGELVTVFGDAHHAIEHLQPVLKATAAMRAVNPHMDAENESYNIARALELKGVSNDPQHFTRLLNGMVQAINATRGKVTGSEFMLFTKRFGAGANLLSDDFYTTVAPTLIQELGGDSSGTALASMRQAIVGGRMKANAVKEFENLGLLDPEKVLRTKGGNVMGFSPGGMQGTALYNSNPYLWMQQVFKPAMDKKGITEPDKVAEYLAHLFGNRRGEAIANILLTQRSRIDKDQVLIKGAPNADSIDTLKTEDPKTVMRDLAAGVTDFLAAAGDPLMKPAIAGLNGLASLMRSLGQSVGGFAPDHPLLAGVGSAAALGGMGYLGVKGFQAMWGFGLPGAATALTGAAGALEAAAGRLGVAGGVPTPGSETSKGKGNFVKNALGVGGTYAAIALGAYEAAVALADYTTKGLKGGGNIVGADPFTGAPIFDNYNGHAPDLSGARSGEPAKAELTGSAEVKTTITVSPSEYFGAFINMKVDNAIKGLNVTGAANGTTGSTGRSMPEAGPMP
jgi:hypothetical protein